MVVVVVQGLHQSEGPDEGERVVEGGGGGCGGGGGGPGTASVRGTR